MTQITQMGLVVLVCIVALGYGLLQHGGPRRWIGIGLAVVACVAALIVNSFIHDQLAENLLLATVMACGLGSLGMAFLKTGLRGPRVGDHPFCAKCGFDLFGRPVGSNRCSECGADLAARSAIVVGQRKRSRKWSMVGGFLTILAALIIVPPTTRTLSRVNWQPHKPVWLLMMDMDAPTRQVAAQVELSKRHYDGNLSPGQTQKWAERRLKDSTRAADPIIALNFLSAPSADEVDESTLRKLMHTAARAKYHWQIPSVVARGHAIPIGGGDPFRGQVKHYTVKHGVVEDRAGEVLILAKVQSTGETVYDLTSQWSAIPNGRVPFTRKVKFVATFPYRGSTLVEEGTFVITSTANVGELREFTLVEPIELEKSAVWTAEIDERGLQIARTIGLNRAYFSVWQIRGAQRTKLGMCLLNAGILKARVRLEAPIIENQKIDALELVPSPDTEYQPWSIVPILNQTVRIEDVKRSASPGAERSQVNFRGSKKPCLSRGSTMMAPGAGPR